MEVLSSSGSRSEPGRLGPSTVNRGRNQQAVSASFKQAGLDELCSPHVDDFPPCLPRGARPARKSQSLRGDRNPDGTLPCLGLLSTSTCALVSSLAALQCFP